MMLSAPASLSLLNDVLDWFIPPAIAADREARKQTRMFLISHLFGPFIGNVIPVALFLVDPDPGYEILVLAASITGFWIFPVLLKITGSYYPLAIASIQNLMFCILWSCFWYGGVTSPTLAWVLSIPLLSFFYLSAAPKLRLVVLGMMAVNFAIFYTAYANFGRQPNLDMHALQGLGIVSTVAASLYVAMMAFIYGKILASQSEIEMEMRRHMATVNELRRATESAEKARRAKADFLARMSHELRTPLNAVIGYSQLLLEDGKSRDAEATDDLNRIHSAGQHLLKLVNEVLDLSKIEANQLKVRNAAVDLGEVLDTVVAAAQASAEAQGNTISVDVSAELPEVVTDRHKLSQIASQIVENAVKFTRQGSVTVSAVVLGEAPRRSVRIAVTDTGIGIAPERLRTIFDDFVGVGDEVGGELDGTGLGLSLSLKLSHLMRGDIRVSSEEGKGSVFTILLPATPDDDPILVASEAGLVRLGDETPLERLKVAA